MRTFIRVVLVIVVLAAAGLGGLYFWLDSEATTPVMPKDQAKEEDFRVPKGTTLVGLGKLLQDAGFIKSAIVWKVYLKLHPAKSPQAGRHPLSKGMAIPELLEVLSGTPLSDDVALTIVEGWRLRDVDEFLANSKLIEPGAYIRAAENPKQFKIPFPFDGPTLEGYLLPNTYMVQPGKLDVVRFIQRQIDNFNERFFVPNQDEIKRSKRSLHDIVTAASMLEREEPTPELRPQVAGVFYKRLDKNTPLGVDATSRYKLADWNDRHGFLKALRDPDDPYNTRLHAGLPPTPIGAPGIPSLIGALRPVESAYWYYLHDSERHIHFSKSAEEHEANRKKYNVY